MSTAKAEVEGMLRILPDDATLEDIQYHLFRPGSMPSLTRNRLT
jgi:hypothetical protein